MTSPYDVLELLPTSTIEEVKQRYRELAMKNHPDKLQHLSLEERSTKEEFFKRVTVAYHVICESKKTPDVKPEEGTAPWKHLWSMFAQDKADLWTVFKNTMSDVATKYQNVHSKEHHVTCSVSLKEVINHEKRKLRLFLQGVPNPVFVLLECEKYPEMIVTLEEVHTVHIHMKLQPHASFGVEQGEDRILHLTYDLPIHLHEILTGCVHTIETIDGRTLSIPIPPCVDVQSPITIPKEGIRGDLIIYLQVIPVSVMRWNALSTEEKENVVKRLAMISL